MAKEPKMKYKIITQYADGLPRYAYKDGVAKPKHIVMHDTGNDSSTIDGEINYMSNNWTNAFVHAWINADKIVETANTDYLCWGGGPRINVTAIQGELVHEHTKDRFIKALDKWIFYHAFQAYWYDIKPSDATDDGKGTIWTHEAVSKFKGGTDHVDPMPYIKERFKKLCGKEITWKQVYNKLFEYWEALEDGKDTADIKMIGEETSTKKTVEKPKTQPKELPNKPKPVIKKKPSSSKNSTTKKYTVKKGDYLEKIAEKYDVSVNDIVKWNGLKSKNLIFVNQVLIVSKPVIRKKPVKHKAPSKTLNPIEYLQTRGLKVSSDPNTYASGVWGLRNYTEYGINYDSFCGGYHRAYDMYGPTGCDIVACFDGVVVEGTSSYGNFGGTVVIANEKLGLQVIYGHLRRPVNLKIGQKIKQGQVIGKQGATNYYNNFMNEHLHIQFQPYQYFESEVQFVCSGIDIKNIDVTKYPAVGLFK